MIRRVIYCACEATRRDDHIRSEHCWFSICPSNHFESIIPSSAHADKIVIWVIMHHTIKARVISPSLPHFHCLLTHTAATTTTRLVNSTLLLYRTQITVSYPDKLSGWVSVSRLWQVVILCLSKCRIFRISQQAVLFCLHCCLSFARRTASGSERPHQSAVSSL